jgi:hypothetical protein
MYAEYGARVKIDGLVDIPDGTTGTIVSDVPLFGHAPNWTIELDKSRQLITMHVVEFDVTQSPSESAYTLTSRWSVDECLERIERIAAIDGRNTARDRYTSALIFELYRLNRYADLQVALWGDEDCWDDGEQYDDDDWTPTDQGERTRYEYDH